MGYNAIVYCRCFQEGKTTPTPFDADWLSMGDDGGVQLKDDIANDQSKQQFKEWSKGCCVHDSMHAAFERIANLSGLQLFREAVHDAGADRFPALVEQMRIAANWGLTPASVSQQLLDEVDALMLLPALGTKTVLVDVHTGAVLKEHVSGSGVFQVGGSSGVNLGLAADGFFICDRTTKTVLFRASRLRQKPLDAFYPMSHYKGRVEFEDIETGLTFLASTWVRGHPIPASVKATAGTRQMAVCEFPLELHMQKVARHASDVDYIVQPLKRTLLASIAMGNPIRWC